MDVSKCSHPSLKENFRIFSEEKRSELPRVTQPQDSTPPLDDREEISELSFKRCSSKLGSFTIANIILPVSNFQEIESNELMQNQMNLCKIRLQ